MSVERRPETPKNNQSTDSQTRREGRVGPWVRIIPFAIAYGLLAHLVWDGRNYNEELSRAVDKAYPHPYSSETQTKIKTEVEMFNRRVESLTGWLGNSTSENLPALRELVNDPKIAESVELWRAIKGIDRKKDELRASLIEPESSFLGLTVPVSRDTRNVIMVVSSIPVLFGSLALEKRHQNRRRKNSGAGGKIRPATANHKI